MKTITIDGIEYQLTPVPTEAPKPVQWSPNRVKKGDEYYFFDGDHPIFIAVEDNRFIDVLRSDSGNYFYTEQEAEEAVKQVRQLLRLRAYVREFAPDWKADWSDDTQEKWFVMLNKDSEKWRANYDRFLCTPTTVYMPKEVAKGLVHKLSSGEVVL